MRKQKLVRVDTKDRYLFFGTFDRFVLTNGFRGVAQKIVLRDIKDQNGYKIANYGEFDNIKTFLKLDLHEGDVISFHARVVVCQNQSDAIYGFYNPYTGVYVRLLNPTKARKLISVVSPLQTNNSYRINIVPRK